MDVNKSERAVTLKDIAEASSVSISTVSRILDDRYPPSQTENAVRVRRIAEQLGYRRNVYASGLRRRESGLIGVLVPRLTDAVMSLMFEAIERAARSRGMFAIVSTCGDDADSQAEVVESLLDRNVDGIILATARVDDAIPERLRQRRLPHVLVLRSDNASPTVTGDDVLGGYLAARHLVDLGHTNISVVTGPTFTSSAHGRVNGARRALTEAGLDLPNDNVIFTGYGIEAGEDAAKDLLNRENRPTAIFAANDNLAIGVAHYAAQLDIKLGPDLSIVGYNDIPLVEKLSVPLTSVRVPFDHIAEKAVDMLREENHHSTTTSFIPTLIPRKSTARPRSKS
ncbi:LacI family DNA-binding transcriptional regulator [Corynebacterium glutamicum]|uniref:LacI family DNA-binding transcriptional regulator n=1 Tax=Corynebacterium glutamicum TaxID=1718 RepID=UPI0009427D8A|nr:LacI family DNA-binding transcriptional regulator [Corynebacterium glutamicum]OKX81064.1 LacI family transcriptional regulator [Corynebacterium glutamicum]